MLRNLGLSSSFFAVYSTRKKTEFSGKAISKISKICKDLNIHWLISGEGEMFRTSDSSAIKQIVKDTASGSNTISIRKNGIANEILPPLSPQQHEIQILKQENTDLKIRNQTLEKDKEHLLSQQKAYTEQIERLTEERLNSKKEN